MVTIAQLLHLPSLREATVVAGHRGLNKPVTAVSVLEYAGENKGEDANKSLAESELVLTAFANVPSDYALQCRNIRSLHQTGEAALVLYYVGIFMPEIHVSLLRTANELDFPLICMPQNRSDYRYSEVIGEVVEAIFHDRRQQTEAQLSGQSTETAISALLSAIVQDEPLKMRRLADVLRIDVASIHGMWVLYAEGMAWQKTAVETLRLNLHIHCLIVVAEEYEGCVVAFFDDDSLPSDLGSAVVRQLEEAEIYVTMCECRNLVDTTDVRTAYLLSRNFQEACRQIWPSGRRFNRQELRFAAAVSAVITEGEAAIGELLAPLNPIRLQRDGGELITTLATHFLDCEYSVTRTAAAMFLHKNTIKYRLGRLTEIMGYPVTKQPECFDLYRAVALKRMLKE